MPDDRVFQHNRIVCVTAFKSSNQRRVQLVSILGLIFCLSKTALELFYVWKLLCGRRLRDRTILQSLRRQQFLVRASYIQFLDRIYVIHRLEPLVEERTVNNVLGREDKLSVFGLLIVVRFVWELV